MIFGRKRPKNELLAIAYVFATVAAASGVDGPARVVSYGSSGESIDPSPGYAVTVKMGEQIVSLNDDWMLEPDGAEEAVEVTVPGFWERIPGLRNVHQATYRREFDIPESFAGQRVFLKFDAVGDAADVSVNG